jgi:hypothetical protein
MGLGMGLGLLRKMKNTSPPLVARGDCLLFICKCSPSLFGAFVYLSLCSLIGDRCCYFDFPAFFFFVVADLTLLVLLRLLPPLLPLLLLLSLSPSPPFSSVLPFSSPFSSPASSGASSSSNSPSSVTMMLLEWMVRARFGRVDSTRVWFLLYLSAQASQRGESEEKVGGARLSCE